MQKFYLMLMYSSFSFQTIDIVLAYFILLNSGLIKQRMFENKSTKAGSALYNTRLFKNSPNKLKHGQLQYTQRNNQLNGPKFYARTQKLFTSVDRKQKGIIRHKQFSQEYPNTPGQISLKEAEEVDEVGQLQQIIEGYAQQVDSGQKQTNRATKQYAELVAQQIPTALVEDIKKFERARLLVLWLKQNHAAENEKHRDEAIRKQGYRIFSSNNLYELNQAYKDHHSKHLILETFLIISYSQKGDNELAITQLFQRFVEAKRVKFLLLIKPTDMTRYNLFLENIKISSRIIQVPYQIEAIKKQIASLELQAKQSYFNFTPLRYWPQRKQFGQIVENGETSSSFDSKCKIVIFTCIKMAKSILQHTKSTQLFKRSLYRYTLFHDLYFQGSNLVIKAEQQQNHLKRFGMQLLQNPLGFYWNQKNQILINRLLMFSGDRQNHLSNIMLPLSVIFQQIKQNYLMQAKDKKYRTQFICYSYIHLNQSEINKLQEGVIFENITFLKAHLKREPHSSQNHLFQNVQVMIYVSSSDRKSNHQSGFCFLQGEIPVDQSKKDSYFKGYEYVLFNLFNSFKVLSLNFDRNKQKYVLEVEYGYIARQYWLKDQENLIPEKVTVHRYKRNYQFEPDYQTIIKSDSNSAILDQIQDFGDCSSLLQLHKEAISYYQTLFKKNKTEMVENSDLLMALEIKKASNYELMSQQKSAIEYYYNALNIVCKGKNESQPQKQLCFSPKLEDIYSHTLRVLFSTKQYEKVIRLGQSLIKNDNRRGGVRCHSHLFLLELYHYLACSYSELVIKRYRVQAQDPRIHLYWGEGLKIVDEIGEYHPSVPSFYIALSRYYLIMRQNYTGTVYLNKSILILKTILTPFDPQLCRFYPLLAIGLLSMHDYEAALRVMDSCISIIEQYFGNKHNKLIPIVEIKAKISIKAGYKDKAIDLFLRQIELLKQARLIKGKSQRKEYDWLGLMNRVEQIQDQVYFDSRYRNLLAETMGSYCLVYISHIYRQQYKYQTALEYLEKALKENTQQHGQSNIFNAQIMLLMAEVKIFLMKAQESLQLCSQAWKILVKNKKQNQPQAISYFKTICSAYDAQEKHTSSYKALMQLRQLLSKDTSLENQVYLCCITDQLGMTCLKIDKIDQARRLFQESEGTRNALVRQMQSRRDSIHLYGLDFEDIGRAVRKGLCRCLYNKAALNEREEKWKLAQQCLRNCLSQSVEVAGEYQLQTAEVYMRLGMLLAEHQQQTKEAFLWLEKALSIFYCSKIPASYASAAKIHLCLKKLQLKRNEPLLSLKQLQKAFQALKYCPQMGNLQQLVLGQLFGICRQIIEMNNLQHLKSAYFILSDLSTTGASFMERNHSGKQQRQLPEVDHLLVGIRQKIQELQPTERQSKQQFSNKQDKATTLSAIKQRKEERKKRRQQYRNKYQS